MVKEIRLDLKQTYKVSDYIYSTSPSSGALSAEPCPSSVKTPTPWRGIEYSPSAPGKASRAEQEETKAAKIARYPVSLILARWVENPAAPTT
jgi:hypothetical protein